VRTAVGRFGKSVLACGPARFGLKLPAPDAHKAGLVDDGVKLTFAYLEHVEKQVALATTTAQLTVAATALLINAYVISVKEYKWNSDIVTS
jgi:hypothetical protein